MRAVWDELFKVNSLQNLMLEIHGHRIFWNSCHFFIVSYSINKYVFLISDNKFVLHSECILPVIVNSYWITAKQSAF